ncbi:MAG TPA: HEAT repeat domain-containing protein, partial [Acidimicrobiia bacterium]|nr:HEAT repeat domain-containing protein [Acidimicrobiia bacterium]
GEVLRARDAPQQARLLELLESFEGPGGLEAARTLLPGAIDPEVIARCLSVLGQHRRPEDAALMRPLLGHPVAFVRLRAVTALGRIMGPGDQWYIASRLGDHDWWVRRRAAEMLVASRRVPHAFVDVLAGVHPDRYARGALAHALSEAGGHP